MYTLCIVSLKLAFKNIVYGRVFGSVNTLCFILPGSLKARPCTLVEHHTCFIQEAGEYQSHLPLCSLRSLLEHYWCWRDTTGEGVDERMINVHYYSGVYVPHC